MKLPCPRRATCALAIGTVVTLLVSGCRVPGNQAQDRGIGPLEATSITVGGLPVVDDAPLYLAEARGMFAAAGLKVTIDTFRSSTAQAHALAGGQIDIAAGSDITFLQQQATGLPQLRMIADGYEAGSNVVAVLVLPNSGITAPRQLANTIIGTPPAQLSTSTWIKNMEDLTTGAVLQDDSVDPASIQWRPMPEAQLIGALARGKVKAIVATEPYIIDAERMLGAVAVLDSCSGPTANLPLSGYFSTDAFVKSHPNTIRAFQQVLNQAQALAAQRGNVQQILGSYTSIDQQTASLMSLGVYPTSLDADRVQQVADLMYESGVISQPIVVSSMVFLPGAAPLTSVTSGPAQAAEAKRAHSATPARTRDHQANGTANGHGPEPKPAGGGNGLGGAGRTMPGRAGGGWLVT